MSITDNIATLHQQEEKIRSETLYIIETDTYLKVQLDLLQLALDMVLTLSTKHHNKNDDELTLQLLGIRSFNFASSSLKLALSGYHQPAFVLLRDTLETTFLIEYFSHYPEQIKIWRDSDNEKIKTQFKPATIRKELFKKDKIEGRAKIYALFSEYASHASPRGFVMTASNEISLIGPFSDKKLLKAFLEELAQRYVLFAMQFSQHFDNIGLELLAHKEVFLTNLDLLWSERARRK